MDFRVHTNPGHGFKGGFAPLHSVEHAPAFHLPVKESEHAIERPGSEHALVLEPRSPAADLFVQASVLTIDTAALPEPVAGFLVTH